MRKVTPIFTLVLFVAGFVAVFPKTAAAQDDDPPGRVARLNYIQGSVSYQVAGDQDWVDADPNRPLTTGDNLWVDRNSRGEVHVGSTAIRMSSETGISFLTLDDRTVQLQLAQGAIEVHVRNLYPGDAFEIDTPNLSFTLERGGEYRIQTDPDGNSTMIVVREGEGEVTGGGESWDLRPGRMYRFNGTDDLSYNASEAPDYDDFEDWCQTRDQRENDSPSARYLSRDVDGYYDLDEYGEWRTDADYGPVWVPRGVEAGWAPYQVGHWVFVAPWGWTWVDAEPWGFAPFHYGRWVFVGGYWGWVPGPIVVRPVYAPALVAFVGGGGVSVTVGFGGGFAGVAWFPLGPRDVYVPGYRCSPRYVQNVNVTNTRVVNVTQVTNVYNNVYINHNTTVINNYTYARNDRAVTAVSRDTFVNARRVSGATVRVSAQQIQNARTVDAAPVAPTRTSYVSAVAKVSTNRPAVPFAQRSVVARLNPAVSRPAPQPANNGRAFGGPQGNTQNGSGGNQRFNNRPQTQGGATPPAANSGNLNQPPPRGNNPPPAAVNNNNAQQNQQQSRDGFHPFQPPAGGSNSQQGGAGNNANNARRNQNNTGNAANNNNQNDRGSNRNDQTMQNEQRPPVRFAPPVKARDENYDVHPPLNQKQPQAQPAPPPRQEERRAEPPPQKQQQENRNQKDDNKKEDDKKH